MIVIKCDYLLIYVCNALGFVSSLCSASQHIPQIYRIIKTEVIGALSIGTIILHVSGKIALIVTLYSRPGVQVSTYISYIVSVVSQCILLCLAYKFK